ncbi:hypothetical protein MAR_ORF126 [Marseillevirus marseillevirus]|uniref:Uncharacterized protein n=1 Tax=Marseillevirus marseillevirus TaxID=694581 RepID=D2XAD2_GBMV|nr:hypothetical protein MAR_ORF126 [Marseillevirus marseillevirus]ADB03909.1 hypothetical protein MAR_ORF126 [Marseillevirus marseillevirus]
MCHTPFLSFVLAVSGTSLAVASKRKKNPMWVVFALYSLMEWLQTTQHFFVDSCGTTANLFLSYVAFGLVVVQPLTWNFYRWLKSTTVRQRAAFSCAMWLSFLWLVFFSARLIPRSSLPSGGTIYQALSKHEIMVGTEVCTRTGPTHLFWTFPLFSFNGVEMNWGAYLLLWFGPSIYERRGWLKMFYWCAQVMLMNRMTGNIHEIPTLWCFYSVPILLGILALGN